MGFPNELECFKDDQRFESHFFRVRRENKDVGEVVGLAGHESEAHDLEYEFDFDNNSDFQTLYNQIDEVMAELGYDRSPKV